MPTGDFPKSTAFGMPSNFDEVPDTSFLWNTVQGQESKLLEEIRLNRGTVVHENRKLFNALRNEITDSVFAVGIAVAAALVFMWIEIDRQRKRVDRLAYREATGIERAAPERSIENEQAALAVSQELRRGIENLLTGILNTRTA